MSFLQKCCQCYWCGYKACGVACCFDNWHGIEACGQASVFYDGCCWALCAPLCIDCSMKMGDTGVAMDNYLKCLKYCVFACALQCVAPCDGCYNCYHVIVKACTDEGIKGYADLMANVEFIGNKVKDALGLTTGSMPKQAMDEIKP